MMWISESGRSPGKRSAGGHSLRIRWSTGRRTARSSSWGLPGCGGTIAAHAREEAVCPFIA